MKTNTIKPFISDTIIIERKRGWRSKLNAVLKSFPPEPQYNKVAILEIRASSNAIIVTTSWRII